MQALQVHAGPAARLIPAAAGGPKDLVLLPLDRFLFGHWLAGVQHHLHLVGASIDAWRIAAAWLPDADAALAQLPDRGDFKRFGDDETGRQCLADEFAELVAGGRAICALPLA